MSTSPTTKTSQSSNAAAGSTSTTVPEKPEKRKRTKYAAKACVECKRRKVKCCGQQPCQRCRRRMTECVFVADDATTDSRDIKKLLANISKMQMQIDTLTEVVESYNSAPSPSLKKRKLSPSKSRLNNNDRSEGSHTSSVTETKISFHGLTTSSFNFGIARQTLRSRGITEAGGGVSGSDDIDEDIPNNQEAGGEREGSALLTRDTSPTPSPMITPHRRSLSSSSTIDPLRVMSRDEAIRLCNVYEEEMGIMYPVLNFRAAINQVNTLYDHICPSTEPITREELLSEEDLNILKMIFACALTAEANGKSDLAMKLFRDVRGVASDVVWQPPNIKRLILITLVSIYLFQADEEAAAWRSIGIAQRLCLEMGLHRSETYPQPAIMSYGKEDVLNLFWSVYTLDMRYSMGTGMPYHLDSSDIDQSLPRPINVPYLNTMISYNRIAERVWRFITSSDPNPHSRKEEMAYLDWQVTQWYNSVPEFLKITTSSTNDKVSGHPNQDQQPRSTRRLKALLYLRANLMKILIYRPILYTPSQIAQSPLEASTVVEIAKNTISFITHLNNSTDIYQLQQVTFNWFLISALAVLFLAVAHAPAQFTSTVKDEFYMALGLIEGFSMRSYVSQRMWKSIKGLRKLGPRIGLATATATATATAARPRGESQAPPIQAKQQQQQQKQLEAYSDTSTLNTIPGPSTGGPAPIPIPNEQDPYQQQPSVDLPTAAPAATTLDDLLLVDGTQMSRELMDWFQAMGEPSNNIFTNLNSGTNSNMNLFVHSNNAEAEILMPGSSGDDLGHAGAAAGWNGMVTDGASLWPATDDLMFGYGSDLASILKDCF